MGQRQRSVCGMSAPFHDCLQFADSCDSVQPLANRKQFNLWTHYEKGPVMGKLILAMNVSIDGYVDNLAGNLVMGAPSQKHFDYWIETIRNHAGAVYGRRMYELMRYWDDDHAEWDASLRQFATLWRKLPKWVVSRTLSGVGPNAALISGDIETQIREIAARTDGTVSVSGPELAGLMTKLGLIEEYHLHVRSFVLGEGKPFFHEARPPLQLVSSTLIDDDTVHMIYVPRN
jgi:dihydrofolate reductase